MPWCGFDERAEASHGFLMSLPILSRRKEELAQVSQVQGQRVGRESQKGHVINTGSNVLILAWGCSLPSVLSLFLLFSQSKCSALGQGLSL